MLLVISVLLVRWQECCSYPGLRATNILQMEAVRCKRDVLAVSKRFTMFSPDCKKESVEVMIGVKVALSIRSDRYGAKRGSVVVVLH